MKWTFGELIYTGPNSGFAWGLNQILDAYAALAILLEGVSANDSLTCINGTASYMERINSNSVDLVCIDPPYYNNVQYAELSDYFYVWMKRTLQDLYPSYFNRRLTNKQDEAVFHFYPALVETGQLRRSTGDLSIFLWMIHHELEILFHRHL